MMKKLLLSKREAARLLGIGRGDTLTMLIETGRIGVVSVAGRIRVPVSEVERVAREGTEPPEDAPGVHPRSESRGMSEADKVRALKI